MKNKIIFISLFFALTLLAATGLVLAENATATTALTPHIEVVDPVNRVVENGTVIELGAVGPGQTLELKFSRDSGALSVVNPQTGKNALWDKAEAINLPEGWVTRDSLLYENPLTVFVTVSPSAREEDYLFSVKFTDEYEGLAPQIIRFKVRPTTEVVDVTLENPTLTTGVGQPAVYTFNIKSKSSASDTFTIRSSGLPYDWTFTKTILLPHNQEKKIVYEVVGNIQKDVSFSFDITSLSSANIKRNVNARVITVTSLLQDAKATSLGLPLFPSIEQNIYALIGFVTNFLFG